MAGIAPVLEKDPAGTAVMDPDSVHMGATAPEAVEGDTVADDDAMPSNVSPEEQQAYEEFVLKGFDLLYANGEVKPEILKLLDDNPEDLKQALGENLPLDAPADPQNPEAGTMWDAMQPVIVLAAAAAIITLEVVKSYPEGEQPEGAVIMHGGAQFLEDLAQIAEDAGIHTYTEEEMADAFRRGADIFRDAAEAEGLVDTEEAKQEWGQIVQADQEGRVDEVVPGIGQLGAQAAPEEEIPA